MRRWKSFPSIFDKYKQLSLPVATEKNACESTFASRKSLHSGCLPLTTNGQPPSEYHSNHICIKPLEYHPAGSDPACEFQFFLFFSYIWFCQSCAHQDLWKVNSFLFIYDSRIALVIGQHLWILVLFRRGFQFVILGRIRLLSSGVQLHSNVIIFLFQNTTSKIWGFIKHTESWTFLPLQPILNHSLHVLLTLRSRPLSSPTHVFLGGSINDKGHTMPTTVFN